MIWNSSLRPSPRSLVQFQRNQGFCKRGSNWKRWPMIALETRYLDLRVSPAQGIVPVVIPALPTSILLIPPILPSQHPLVHEKTILTCICQCRLYPVVPERRCWHLPSLSTQLRSGLCQTSSKFDVRVAYLLFPRHGPYLVLVRSALLYVARH